MRYLDVFTVCAALAATGALLLPTAKRLEPRPGFDSVRAEGYGVLVGPKNEATTEMTVTYTIRGKRGTAYSVELYVEPHGTGEKSKRLRTAKVTVGGNPSDGEGTATGAFVIRDLHPGEPDSETNPALPWTNLYLGWTVQLVMKQDGQVVASSGPDHAPFNWKKPIHVTE